MSKIKLPPEKITELRQHQRALHDILPELDDVEKCGVDCTPLREMRDTAMDQIEKMITYFGPGKQSGK